MARSQFTITTTEEMEQSLEENRKATGRPNKQVVLLDAYDLYDLIVQQMAQGKHLYLGMSKESAGEVLLPHLERAAGRRTPLRVIDGDKDKK